MAKVTYIDPIKEISGKLTKSHSTVLNVRRAKTSNQDMIDNHVTPLGVTQRRKSNLVLDK